jgi:hypothetical protein
MMKRLFSVLIVSIALLLAILVSPGHGNLVTLYPSVDTYVGTYNVNQSNGGSNLMNVGAQGPTPFRTYRAFLKFDLSGIPDNSILTAAELHLYYSGGNPDYYSLYHVSADSSITDAMTWATQPTYDSTSLDGRTVTSTPTRWNTWNLLASGTWPGITPNDLTDNFVSLLIKGDESTSGPYILTQLYTLETLSGHDYDPYLVISYDVQPVPIPGAILLFAPGLAGLIAIRRRFKK